MTTLSPPESTADTPVESIIELTGNLVRIPSRANADKRDLILRYLTTVFEKLNVPVDVLKDEAGEPVAVLATADSGVEGPSVALNACADTAGFGDESLWSHPPTGGDIVDGWLYGRGAADSKVAVAMFAHLTTELVRTPPPAGRLLTLFDVDEHTGRFGGARAFQKHVRLLKRFQGMMIGYPGNFGVVAGARGFWRATITARGTSAHSGSTSAPRDNAVSKAARMIVGLEGLELPEETDGGFPFGPSLTVTAVHGGEGYSQVPDTCALNVDVRLTPSFGAEEASGLVQSVVFEVKSGAQPPTVDVEDSWPAYQLDDDEPVLVALRRAAERHLGREVPAVTCGPSNIGNFLSAHGIPATCGFGVTYRNIHGTDEAIELASIGPAYRAYRDAVLELLSA